MKTNSFLNYWDWKKCFVFTKDGLFRNEEWIGDLSVIKIPKWWEANFVLTGNVKSAQTFRKVKKDKINGRKYMYTAIWLEGEKGLSNDYI